MVERIIRADTRTLRCALLRFYRKHFKYQLNIHSSIFIRFHSHLQFKLVHQNWCMSIDKEREMVWGLAHTTMRNVCTACSNFEIRCDKIGFHCMYECVRTYAPRGWFTCVTVLRMKASNKRIYSNFVSLAIERTVRNENKPCLRCHIRNITLEWIWQIYNYTWCSTMCSTQLCELWAITN